MGCNCGFPAEHLTAGDDYTYLIPLRIKGQEPGEPVLAEGDTLRAIVTAYDKTFSAEITEVDAKTAQVYFSCALTGKLGEMKCGGIHLCVHIDRAGGGCSTVEFCEDPDDIDAPRSKYLPLVIDRCHP